MIEFFTSDQCNGCKALPLAVEGWLEIMNAGHGAGNFIIVQHGQNVLWAEEDGVPIGVILWTKEDWRKEIWIWLSYVRPQNRRNGIYRQLFARIVDTAHKLGMKRISGGTAPSNKPMREAAFNMDRRVESLTYTYVLEPKS